MKGHIKVLVLVVVVAAVATIGVYVYFLTLPRTSILVYPDTRVTGTKERLNETIILHLRNEGTEDLNINGSEIAQDTGTPETSSYVTYIFQDNIIIPSGVEAVITFPAGGGKVIIETVSGPAGVAAAGGLYAISDNPDPNPFRLVSRTELWIHTKSRVIGGGGTSGGIPIAAVD